MRLNRNSSNIVECMDSKWLHRIIEMEWESGTVPSHWAKAVIAPIYKQRNRKYCNNYRGISTISVVDKIF